MPIQLIHDESPKDRADRHEAAVFGVMVKADQQVFKMKQMHIKENIEALKIDREKLEAARNLHGLLVNDDRYWSDKKHLAALDWCKSKWAVNKAEKRMREYYDNGLDEASLSKQQKNESSPVYYTL